MTTTTFPPTSTNYGVRRTTNPEFEEVHNGGDFKLFEAPVEVESCRWCDNTPTRVWKLKPATKAARAKVGKRYEPTFRICDDVDCEVATVNRMNKSLYHWAGTE